MYSTHEDEDMALVVGAIVLGCAPSALWITIYNKLDDPNTTLVRLMYALGWIGLLYRAGNGQHKPLENADTDSNDGVCLRWASLGLKNHLITSLLSPTTYIFIGILATNDSNAAGCIFGALAANHLFDGALQATAIRQGRDLVQELATKVSTFCCPPKDSSGYAAMPDDLAGGSYEPE